MDRAFDVDALALGKQGLFAADDLLVVFGSNHVVGRERRSGASARVV